jgi:hypothetical protein
LFVLLFTSAKKGSNKPKNNRLRMLNISDDKSMEEDQVEDPHRLVPVLVQIHRSNVRKSSIDDDGWGNDGSVNGSDNDSSSKCSSKIDEGLEPGEVSCLSESC